MEEIVIEKQETSEEVNRKSSQTNEEDKQVIETPKTRNGSKKWSKPFPADETDMEAGTRLAKILDRVQGIEGVRAAEVFRDFLEITELTLLRLGDQCNSVLRTGKVEEEDPPEIAARWKAVAKNYRNPSPVFGCFAEGFAYLLDKSATEDGEPTYADVLGCAYMQFLSMRDQAFKGQFFTPSHVARMMAEINCQDIEKLILERLKEAIEKSPIAQALGLAVYICKDLDGVPEVTWKYLLPAIADEYEPVTILDPCVGSGIMLLAAAAIIPRQYTALGLVQYYGMDIDAYCCQMARINAMLYGLNGWSYRLEDGRGTAVALKSMGGVWDAEAAPEMVIAAIPEPARSIYKEVRLEPNEEKKQEGRRKILEGQMEMFSSMEPNS